MNKERVKIVVDGLVRICKSAAARKRFDLGFWSNGRDVNESKPEEWCGFAGCVVGWAGHERWFESEGLRVEIAGSGIFSSVSFRKRDRLGRWQPIDSWNNTTNDVLGKFFEIRPFVLEGLIYVSGYSDGKPDLEEVIERFKYLYDRGEKAFCEEFGVYPEDDEDGIIYGSADHDSETA